jgi:hypothetical protein
VNPQTQKSEKEEDDIVEYLHKAAERLNEPQLHKVAGQVFELQNKVKNAS